MHKVALIPGAGYDASSLWPLQQLADKSLIPIDYRRGGPYLTSRNLLDIYAERVFEQLKDVDGPVDIYGHSMGAIVSLAVVALADAEKPGLVRKVILLTPGVFGGRPSYMFHRSMSYLSNLIRPDADKMRPYIQALDCIRKSIPDYDPEIKEDGRAMLEAGDGVIDLPPNFDRRRLSFYYAPEDTIVPENISLEVAARAGLEPQPICGFGHFLPIIDTKGEVLREIRKANR